VNDETGEETPALRVGIVGWGWMGHVHARAYARLRQHYRDAPLKPALVAVADNAADERLRAQSTHSDSAMRTGIGATRSLVTTSTWSV
jgi:predicted dehydrogenase